MTYKKGQWLKCEIDWNNYFTKGNTYKISGTDSTGDIYVYDESGGIYRLNKNEIIKYFSPAPKTFKTLEVGDIIVNEYGNERMVLDVYEHSFLVSLWDDFTTPHSVYTPEYAKHNKHNWTIKGADTDDKTEEAISILKEKGYKIIKK